MWRGVVLLGLLLAVGGFTDSGSSTVDPWPTRAQRVRTAVKRAWQVFLNTLLRRVVPPT